MNAGSAVATGDIFLFLHADTVLEQGWAKELCASLDDASVIGGAFTFRIDNPAPKYRLVEAWVSMRCRIFKLPYGDQAVFVTRETLEAIGGIPRAPIMEDLDLVRAMRARGRLARLDLPVTTSARRYRARGVTRTVLRNALAAVAWRFDVDRQRVADWYQR